jgi:hypothetical protein
VRVSIENARSTIVALVAACALLPENLDSTVISTALPGIARSFGSEPVDLSLGITAYMGLTTRSVPRFTRPLSSKDCY